MSIVYETIKKKIAYSKLRLCFLKAFQVVRRSCHEDFSFVLHLVIPSDQIYVMLVSSVLRVYTSSCPKFKLISHMHIPQNEKVILN